MYTLAHTRTEEQEHNTHMHNTHRRTHHKHAHMYTQTYTVAHAYHMYPPHAHTHIIYIQQTQEREKETKHVATTTIRRFQENLPQRPNLTKPGNHPPETPRPSAEGSWPPLQSVSWVTSDAGPGSLSALPSKWQRSRSGWGSHHSAPAVDPVARFEQHHWHPSRPSSADPCHSVKMWVEFASFFLFLNWKPSFFLIWKFVVLLNRFSVPNSLKAMNGRGGDLTSKQYRRLMCLKFVKGLNKLHWSLCTH